MKPYEWSALATYNSEKHRGVVHTPEQDALMAAEQRRFNEAKTQQWIADGWKQLPGHPNMWVSPVQVWPRWWKRLLRRP